MSVASTVYKLGFSKKLHITKEEFISALEKSVSIASLCDILKKSKPSVYTYASRFGIELKKRWSTGIRKKDGYYHYDNLKNHRQIMQQHLGRKLEKHEAVHHIDGNKLNNDLSNLIILDWSTHQKSHASLQNCAFELFKQGLIVFEPNTNTYKLK